MILAIGDSFTYGAELANPGNDAWPTVLGRLLNQDVVNQGLTGSSNDRILRLAATNVVKYDLVICAWSGIDRSEVHSRKGLVQLNFNVRTEIITYPWLKQYLTDHYNYDHATQCWIIDVIMLQAYFQQIQQPFLFVNAIYKKIPSSLRYLWDKVGDKTFIDKNNRDRKSTRLNSSHVSESRMPSSA